MLSLFPIHFLSPLAYILLRLCVGFVFIFFARTHLRHFDSFSRVFSLPIFPYGRFVTGYVIIAEILIGTLFVLGLFTQVAALIAVAYCIKLLVLYKHFSHPKAPSRQTLLLLLFASLSLFITGPGIFAYDLPI